MSCSPQRYLANNRNAVRPLAATLTPSSVQAIADRVRSLLVARTGTAQVSLTGSYTGTEEATYDVEILDDTVVNALISSPVFAGAGSGKLTGIVANAAGQTFTVQLNQAGTPEKYAQVDFEGVILRARQVGTPGNLINITIDRSPLVFTPTNFSLLTDLTAGQGSESNGIEGAGMDWDTKVIDAHDVIPASAHRIAFGEDTSEIYLQYKRYTDGKWLYHFVPELKQDVSKGTRVKFVTGGRDVTITNGIVTPETFTNIVTLFDFLNVVRTLSTLVDVTGVVANDRTPTGQAARELVTRTDSHVQRSTGSGSAAAKGFVDTFAGPNASTELVTATCFAVNGTDHPLAHLGNELWKLRGSVSDDLGTIHTDQAYVHPEGKFGLRIPLRLPDAFGTPRGRFEVQRITEVNGRKDDPPICPVALSLGPDAIDQTITLTYTKRPSGACLCAGIPVPNLGGPCLGNPTGDGEMAYQPDTVTRVIALRQFIADTIRAQSSVLNATTYNIASQDHFIDNPFNEFDVVTGVQANTRGLESLKEIADSFEGVIAQIDALAIGSSPDYRGAGGTAWDAAFLEFENDVATFLGLSPPELVSIPSDRYESRLLQVLITAGIPTVGKADASILQSGDGCWRDWGDPFYWTVVGSLGSYAPAFNNHPYYASRRAGDTDKYFSTHEFAFQINVKCPGALQEGDEIVLVIGNAAWPTTYQVGDVLTLPVIAAQALYLTGGQNGNEIETWNVSGSVAGPLADFVYDPGAPTPYDSGDSPPTLQFTLTPGGIPFDQGDVFRFAVVGGHYRSRKNGGSWSASTPIPAIATAFDSGLSIAFTPGTTPAFVAGDVFSFRALQPWAVSNVQSPTPFRWQWTGSSATLDIDLGTVQTLDALALALHTLPAGSVVELEGSVAPLASPPDWTEAVTWRVGTIMQPFTLTRSARYLRLTLTSATGGGIGWLWVGQALTTTRPGEFQGTQAYNVKHGSGGLFQGGQFLAKTRSGEIEWKAGALTESDATAIVALLDWVKANNDEPFVFVPNVSRPDHALLARVVLDEVELHDEFDYQPTAPTYDRLFSARLPLAGVWQ